MISTYFCTNLSGSLFVDMWQGRWTWLDSIRIEGDLSFSAWIILAWLCLIDHVIFSLFFVSLDSGLTAFFMWLTVLHSELWNLVLLLAVVCICQFVFGYLFLIYSILLYGHLMVLFNCIWISITLYVFGSFLEFLLPMYWTSRFIMYVARPYLLSSVYKFSYSYPHAS